MNKMIPSEHEEQALLIAWCRYMELQDPAYRLIFAIPNGGQRNKVTAAKLKAEGVKPGVPDLFLPIPRGIYAGLFIEMKRQKNGHLSADQREWLRDLMSRGYKCIVARGFEEARDAIILYLQGSGFEEREEEDVEYE